METRSQIESRIARVEKDTRHLWMPGRRDRLVCEWYDIGYASREINAFDLMERCLRTAIRLRNDRRPEPTRRSLGTFSAIAACHNLLGLRYLDEQRFSEAATEFDAAIRLRSELRRLFPKDRENEVYLGGALCNRGHASASSEPGMARQFYEQSLAVLRQANRMCECSYWDESRQSWWCEQLEALGQATGVQWVALAPLFIDYANVGLQTLAPDSATEP